MSEQDQEMIGLWLGQETQGARETLEDWLNSLVACPFAATPDEMPEAFQQLEASHMGVTIGYIPQELLTQMRAALHKDRAPQRLLVLSFDESSHAQGLKAIESTVVVPAPGMKDPDTILKAWQQQRPTHKVVGLYAPEMVDFMWESCQSLVM